MSQTLIYCINVLLLLKDIIDRERKAVRNENKLRKNSREPEKQEGREKESKKKERIKNKVKELKRQKKIGLKKHRRLTEDNLNI